LAAAAAWFFWGGEGGCNPTLVLRWLWGCVLRGCTRADANAIAKGRCEGRAGVYRKKLAG
jgi:hypothetical protein